MIKIDQTEYKIKSVRIDEMKFIHLELECYFDTNYTKKYMYIPDMLINFGNLNIANGSKFAFDDRYYHRMNDQLAYLNPSSRVYSYKAQKYIEVVHPVAVYEEIIEEYPEEITFSELEKRFGHKIKIIREK